MKGRPLSTIRSVLFFLLIALIWIFLTDYILFRFLGREVVLYPYLQSVKGATFVILTAVTIYLLLRCNDKYFKRQFDSLVFNHRELETILSDTSLGIARLNTRGEFLYTNPFFCSLTGYTKDELLHKNYTSIIRKENNVELEYWDTLLKQEKLRNMKDIAVVSTSTKEKLICNISVSEVKDKLNGTVYIMILENITDRTREQKQLKENLKRYSILSMTTMEGLWDWNMETGQYYYHSNLKLLFGYDDHDLEQGYQFWKSKVHEDDREKIIDKMNAAMEIAHLTSLNNEYRFLCKDGSYKIVSDNISILRNLEGKAFRLIGSMHDITEQRNLQAQLAEKEVIYRRHLARTVLDTQENERKKLAEELHDNVNQLLGVVKLYIEHAIADDAIRDSLLKKSNEYIDKVIEELRNLTRNLAPPLLAELGLEQSLISIAETIEEVQPINIRIDIENIDEASLQDGQKLMLYRIVQEQLNNVVKHANAANVTVHLEQIDNKVSLVITDDGRGTDLSTDQGQGMGLRNIRNRIELYQGTVAMDSAPGKGFVLDVAFEI
ncbi:MAG: PAS domain S-box protein [Chitinophagaceae bacterium]|nr:PAS domain S-box protein [Chitinophagaceae bacterium]